MRSDAGWSRRTFVTTFGLAGVATALPAGLEAATGTPMAMKVGQRYALYLTHSLMMPATIRHSIVTMQVDGTQWTTPSARGVKSGRQPSAIARHPVLPVAYVAHARTMGHEGRPCASVTAYAMDDGTGELCAMQTEPLALSSLSASSMAVSPDGRWLLVAGTVGGVYSVLPLGEDGRVGAVESALKMTGGGPWRTLPHLTSVLFHPSGMAYGVDMAMHRLQVISFAEGMPELGETFTFAGEDGPMKMAISPAGDALFVVLRRRPGVAMFRLDRTTGALLGAPSMQAVEGTVGVAIAADATGEQVYAATQEDGVALADHGGSATLISVFSQTRRGDGLRLMERIRVPEILDARRLLRQGNELLVVGLGGVVSVDVGRGQGGLGTARHVVRGGPFSDALVREL